MYHAEDMDCEELRKVLADMCNCAYQQGRADVITEIAKMIDYYACNRDVNLMERINQYIYEQTKEQKNE